MFSYKKDQPTFYKKGVSSQDIKIVVDGSDDWYNSNIEQQEIYYNLIDVDGVLLFEKTRTDSQGKIQTAYVRAFLFDTLFLQPLSADKHLSICKDRNYLELHFAYNAPAHIPTMDYYYAINLPQTLEAYFQSLPRKSRQDLQSINRKRTITSRLISNAEGWHLLNEFLPGYIAHAKTTGNAYYQPFYWYFFKSDIIDQSRILFLVNEENGQPVSVSLCFNAGSVLYGLCDFNLDVTRKCVKEATLANIDWAIGAHFKQFDMFNACFDQAYWYKKKFFNGIIPIPLKQHGDCAWVMDHDLIQPGVHDVD